MPDVIFLYLYIQNSNSCKGKPKITKRFEQAYNLKFLGTQNNLNSQNSRATTFGPKLRHASYCMPHGENFILNITMLATWQWTTEKLWEKLNWTCAKSPCTMSAFVTFHCNFSFLDSHILLFTIFATDYAVERSKVSMFLIETIVKFISHFQKEIFYSEEYRILKDSIVNLRI